MKNAAMKSGWQRRMNCHYLLQPSTHSCQWTLRRPKHSSLSSEPRHDEGSPGKLFPCIIYKSVYLQHHSFDSIFVVFFASANRCVGLSFDLLRKSLRVFQSNTNSKCPQSRTEYIFPIAPFIFNFFLVFSLLSSILSNRTPHRYSSLPQ